MSDTNWQSYYGNNPESIMRAFGCFVAVLLLAACSVGDRTPSSVPAPPRPTEMGDKQVKKDQVILEAAARIDENNEAAPDSEQKPLIDSDVDVIREAIAGAPAADLVPYLAALVSISAERDALKKENARLAKEVQDAKDSIWRQVRFWGTAVLYGLGVACVLLIVLRAKAAFSTGLNPLDAVKSCVMLATLAASLFATARFLSSDYFWYAIGGVLALGAGYVGYLVWSEQRAKAAVRALKPIVRALDDAYESADDAVKKDLDANVFSKLSAEMKQVPGAKSLIHSVRAESAAG